MSSFDTVVCGTGLKTLQFTDEKLYKEYEAEQRAINEKWAKRLTMKYQKGDVFRNKHATLRVKRVYDNGQMDISHTWVHGNSAENVWLMDGEKLEDFMKDLNFSKVK